MEQSMVVQIQGVCSQCLSTLNMMGKKQEVIWGYEDIYDKSPNFFKRL